ncbi:hypothetical protein K470DRAFT_145549 [Piedraia hortae CBS 480.64]|uniref:Uncharacterized protein n=1 Tax=Piedraia hortae CBS 480.64 TaxID=1314780 RepID=A0A6A7BUA7_9PEZI|nr:hypothetical protein K470DRAFT_145549 [Piedraia hortae CBS 480.64]
MNKYYDRKTPSGSRHPLIYNHPLNRWISLLLTFPSHNFSNNPKPPFPQQVKNPIPLTRPHNSPIPKHSRKSNNRHILPFKHFPNRPPTNNAPDLVPPISQCIHPPPTKPHIPIDPHPSLCTNPHNPRHLLGIARSNPQPPPTLLSRNILPPHNLTEINPRCLHILARSIPPLFP